MSAVRTAIRNRLLSDSTLMALCATPTSVFHRHAPQTGKVPLIIIDKRSGVRVWTFGGTPMAYETWMIKGVAFARTADRAEDIAARIEVVMNDAPLVISGRACLDSRLESEVDYPEQVGKETVQHCGGVYRIIVG